MLTILAILKTHPQATSLVWEGSLQGEDGRVEMKGSVAVGGRGGGV